MKHFLFEPMGDEYPFALQHKHPHVFTKLIALWNHPKINNYFTSLLIDSRVGRKGFDHDVFKDINRLFKFHEIESLSAVESKSEIINEIERLNVKFNVFEFLNVVSQGNQKLLDLFVRAGINVNACNDNGESCLQIALKSGFTVIANILLRAGADVEVKDASGLTPLQVACGNRSQGYRKLVKQMILVGADVNVCDSEGWTPLMRAISTNDEDLAVLLLKNGADPNSKTPEGDDALALAGKFGCVGAINFINENNQGSLTLS
jgi:ankyrin repeat protein